MLGRLWNRQSILQRTVTFERLEERIVLEAGGGADAGAQDNSDDNQDPTPPDAEGGEAAAGQAGDPSGAGDSSDPLGEVFPEDPSEVITSNALARVLVVSSSVAGADQLAAAAQDDVLVVLYDGSNDTPGSILSEIEGALDGRDASSIAFATHDLGEAKFHLVGGYTVSPSTLLGTSELQSFWQGVGDLLTEEGRIDVMACDLASTDSGLFLVSQLEGLTGRDVAASDDPTGDPGHGGDWVLETGGVDLAAVYFVSERLSEFGFTLAAEEKVTAGGASPYDNFGSSVSVSGNWAIIGVPGDDDDGNGAGAVYMFKWTGSYWTEYQKLRANATDSGDAFGSSVSIAGGYAIVGAPGDDDGGDDSGSAYIYKWYGDFWGELQKVTAEGDAAAGDEFGCSVSISGEYAVVGAHWDDDGGDNSGSAYIFKRDGTFWSRQAALTASDPAAYDEFGYSVSISGEYAIVGTPYDDEGGDNSGSAYIFKRDGTSWSQKQRFSPGAGSSYDEFGSSVSISGEYAIVGAPYDDDDGDNSGSAWILKRTGTVWLAQEKLTASDPAANDWFGSSVSISGD